MRIALCDDDKILLSEMKPQLYEYANSHSFELVVDEFYAGESLLSSHYLYDIIFLDYKMGNLNGLETAKRIRELNMECAIIFITSYKDDFILESFTVNTYRFLVKPLSQNTLYEVLDDYFALHGFDYPVLVNGQEHVKIHLHSKEIVFIEANNKHCIIHLQKSVLHCTRTMAKLFKDIPHHHFFKVNRAFIINFNYVYKYDNAYITFINNEKVHVSRKYLVPFKEAFKKYSDLRRPQK